MLSYLHRIRQASEMVELFRTYQRSHNHGEVEACSTPSPLCPSASEDPVQDVIEFIKKVNNWHNINKHTVIDADHLYFFFI